MKKIIMLMSLFFLFSSSMVFAGDIYVNGYYKRNGTFVKPHYRSSPNNSVYDNWSTKGNINPYTGKRGTRNPYSQGSLNSRTFGTNQGNLNSGSGIMTSEPSFNNSYKRGNGITTGEPTFNNNLRTW